MKKIIYTISIFIIITTSFFAEVDFAIIIKNKKGLDNNIKKSLNDLFRLYYKSSDLNIYFINELTKKYSINKNDFINKNVIKKIGVNLNSKYLFICKIKKEFKNLVLYFQLFETEFGNEIYKEEFIQSIKDLSNSELYSFINKIITINNKIRKIMYFKRGFDISIGGGLSPFFYSNKSSFNYIDPKGVGYHYGALTNYRFGLLIPFSFTYFFHPLTSIGFIFKIGYYPGLVLYYFSPGNSPNISNNIFFNLGIKHKFGEPSWNFRFILEYGILLDIEILNNLEYDIFQGMITQYGGLYVGVGPIVFIGIEIRRKNFSFETGAFYGCSFGYSSMNDYILNINRGYFDLVITGIEFRFNFYSYSYRYKTIKCISYNEN